MFPRKCFLLTRRRIAFFVIPLLVISAVFIIYQITIFVQLSNELRPKERRGPLLRGIHEQQERFYRPNGANKFRCITSLEEIDFSRVNDDYCDCLDASDEPGTNACPNGVFFCGDQIVTKRFRRSVASAKVNDGICDCCDGSDEWANNQALKLDRKYRNSMPSRWNRTLLMLVMDFIRLQKPVYS
ncbi:hypothetical protein NQ318_013885 [Aromia moschata]|uniref:Glucosidase II beta subunit N-terminal domain-containing protein n=1 Tax=Aromia moschata TaxID=1265417 RepID=A0AAV8ZA26_9CUCU|nr:hypothetical protein NQ318_013885 [Aromia moschata]